MCKTLLRPHGLTGVSHRGLRGEKRAAMIGEHPCCPVAQVLGRLLVGMALFASSEAAQPVPVHYQEGLTHGFLLLRTPEGEMLAVGDLLQTCRGDRVTTQSVFRF